MKIFPLVTNTTWTGRVPFSSCAEWRNNGDKRVGCKQKHKANHASMNDSMDETVWSMKYWWHDWEIQPSSSGWGFDKILCWSEEKRQLRIRTGLASGDASIHWQLLSSPKELSKYYHQWTGVQKVSTEETLKLIQKQKMLWYQGMQGSWPSRAHHYNRVEEEIFWTWREIKNSNQNGVDTWGSEAVKATTVHMLQVNFFLTSICFYLGQFVFYLGQFVFYLGQFVFYLGQFVFYLGHFVST